MSDCDEDEESGQVQKPEALFGSELIELIAEEKAPSEKLSRHKSTTSPAPTPSLRRRQKISQTSGTTLGGSRASINRTSRISFKKVPADDDDDCFHQPSCTVIAPNLVQDLVADSKPSASGTSTPKLLRSQSLLRSSSHHHDGPESPLLANLDGGRLQYTHLDVLEEESKESAELEPGPVDAPDLADLRRYSLNTQDSGIFANAPIKCGNFEIVQDPRDLRNKPKKHYLCVDNDVSLPAVTEFMANFWGLRNPNIVLSVISNEDHFKPWKNQKLRDDLQKGIIKALNTTNMWIITHGFNNGVAKLIGEAVKEYNIEQQNSRIVSNQYLSLAERMKRRLPVIGIVPKDKVLSGAHLDEMTSVTAMKTTVIPEVHELNLDHSHFIIVDDDEREGLVGTLRCRIEAHFRKQFGTKKRLIRMMSMGEDGQTQTDASDTQTIEVQYLSEVMEHAIPVLGLLVQGHPHNLDHVMYFLENKMPIVILKDSGGLADVLGYAHDELHEKADLDPDFEQNTLKPELIKMIVRIFGSKYEDNEVEKLQLRDRIIQCVKMAHDGEASYITVVNAKTVGGNNLKDLDKFLLKALLKSEKTEGVNRQEQLQNDLQLTIDWNRPDLAAEIFQLETLKVRIDRKMFEKALLQKDREKFIDLFITQGVRVHRYLNHKKLKLLFEKAEDREFFITVCLEGMLGTKVTTDKVLGSHFMSKQLNRMLQRLTLLDRFIVPEELTQNAVGNYKNTEDANVAERKALNCLMVWAVLMHRHKLAKTLWSHCNEPIAMALLCSRIYKEMIRYHLEQYQKKELEDLSKEFADMALGALNICFKDASAQALYMLGKQLPDYNDKTVVEIAHDARAIHFMAHPCVQKWLTQLFMGNLHVKELEWGFFRLPYWFKIISSVLLIFPMYIWIRFTPPAKMEAIEYEEAVAEEEEDEDDDDCVDEANTSYRKKKLKSLGRIKHLLTGKKNVPFYLKYYLLWTAPVTKFWITQLFYFMFLGVFSLATLWPTCGNWTLDCVVFLSALMIEMELVWTTYKKKQRFKTMTMMSSYMDLTLIGIFLITMLIRLLDIWHGISDYTRAREMNCYALIYFYYRLLGTYLPISPTLGPMLNRIKRMVSHDFVAFMRMFLIFMIVGGVTTQSILYPHWPMNLEMFKRVFTRPLYALFRTDIDDLTGNPDCSPDYKKTLEYCDTKNNYSTSEQGHLDILRLERCPNTSFSAYVITLQYLFICKLVLVTLLFALFALTNAKVNVVASDLWKFQRYALIENFKNRLTLPPPLTFINLTFIFLKYVYRKCYAKCKECCNPEKDKLKYVVDDMEQDDSVFWKKVAKDYIASEEQAAEKESKLGKIEDILLVLQDDLKRQKKGIKLVTEHMVEIERMMQSHRLYLEDLGHKQGKNELMGITNTKGTFIHIAARQSPYPGTHIERFPVFDKYVPWEILYDVYDPKTFSLEKSKFPESEILFVDEDILEIILMKCEKAFRASDLNIAHSNILDFMPQWNTVTKYKENDVTVEVDRRSWIYVNGIPMRYAVDPLEIPINPMGRTGMRGKGVLWRWGPNHMIKVVVTRWRRMRNPDGTFKFLYVEGKRVLEFIAVQKVDVTESDFALPGDVLHGLSNPHSILCQAFIRQVLGKEKQKQYDTDHMIQFFSKFAAGPPESLPSSPGLGQMPFSLAARSVSIYSQQTSVIQPLARSNMDSRGFCPTLLYKGYLDDPRNTDNAWVETEVWNFHYDHGDTFDSNLPEDASVKWKEVSPYVKMFGNEGVIVQEAARIHEAYH
ncbi:transient receptor potential cation channel subfamily M member-like 2 isoform X2 [Dreissena polymorpha]|uniref:Uncharacterized protein n=1 Tax=Dreissena polymorpha TaxID=45954 RepID=A0A9D4EPC5_DREPO|nr:transient receptor potential cation channel subfamily M member-like 2 isoform X2 [Dreissena polymorpha]KAH3781577.1 hypothetical protein DPMN_159474 [Dreissena polymorpha]